MRYQQLVFRRMSEQNEPQADQGDAKEKIQEDLVPATSVKSTQAHSSATGYISDLPSCFSADLIRTGFRTLRDGLFVSEDCFGEFIRNYQIWLEEKTGRGAPSVNKCKRRLFHDEEPQLFYLLDGKQCLVGYKLQTEISPEKYALPYCSGNVLDVADYLHPRDPLLQSVKGLEAKLLSQGLELKINAHSQDFFLEVSALKGFTAVAKKSYKLKKIYSQAVFSLRSALEPFIISFKKARLATRKKALLVPARYRGESFTYFKLGSLVFVAEENKLIDCYELVGNNLYRFIKTECKMLTAAHRARSVGALQVNLGKRQQIGTIKTPETLFSLELAAFQQFLEITLLSSQADKGIIGFFTVRDCLKSFTRLFLDSKWIEKKQLPQRIREHEAESASFRTSGNYVFVITNKNLIAHCLEKYPKKDKREQRRYNKRTDRRNDRRSDRRNDRPRKRRP